MGRICPILNHPLIDGVLVEDEALVNFIQKRNVDFLPNELVCRSCKREVTKLYNKKLKRAIELHRSRYHDGSISSLKTTSGASSKSSTIDESAQVRVGEQGRIVENGRGSSISATSLQQKNVSKTNSFVQNNENYRSATNIRTPSVADNIPVSETSIRLTTSISNVFSILQENQNTPKPAKTTTPLNTTEVRASLTRNVTIRKRNIKDFLTSKPTQTAITETPKTTMKDTLSVSRNTNVAVNHSKSVHVTSDTTHQQNTDDVAIRHSQEPTTSRAVAVSAVSSNKRPISAVADSDNDDDVLSLNAHNGTRLPHIQPLPPKRKSKPNNANTLAQDVMDSYIKDITGG